MGTIGTKDRSRDTGRQVERRENDNGTHTQCKSAVIAEEENESQQCLSFSQPDCQTASAVLSALCLFPASFFFFFLSFSHTVISLSPAPLARVESKAFVSLLFQLVLTVLIWCTKKALAHDEEGHVWFNL